MLRSLPVGHVVAVGHGLAATRSDGVDHLADHPRRATRPVDLGAEIIDDDLGALVGELEGVAAADAPTRARHDDHPTVADAAHGPSRTHGSASGLLRGSPVSYG